MTLYSSLERLDVRRLPDAGSLRFTVIDFETNGAFGSETEVIEFAAVKVAFGELRSEVSSLCGASAPLPLSITRLTGISDRMLIGKPRFEEFLDFFLGYIGDDILVAHNAPFDVPILLSYCARAGIDFRPMVLCTLANSRRVYPGLPSYSLGALGERFGLFDGRAHRALADSRAAARLLLRMLGDVSAL